MANTNECETFNHRMSDSTPTEVEVFTEALRLPARERAAFLQQACGGDKAMRQRIEALLDAHGEVGDFLEESAAAPDIAHQRPSPTTGLQPGDRIDRYKLLQQIGEGGCGVVFMAEQELPLRRKVALKIIKPGMDTKSVIARFEAERQALAMMDHPNIAKIFDAGATASGRPYFVMELVRGIKITEFCDQNALDTAERLKLFVQVCKAVQHAHQKGIIHRDIKPSNILVTTGPDGCPLPVVIDFGIAKATTQQPLTDKTLFTAFEMLIGTPAYMSPEQAAFTSLDIDTRSDIYSLGVLLYELLTGSTPFDSVDLLKAGVDEVRRVIRDQEALPPSTRLVKMGRKDLSLIARNRRVDAPSLIRGIHGDLDWIAMKALEKDRTRRYETANGLALDVERFLTNEGVSARPPSKLYKFRKTVQRNKLLFVAAALLTLVLLASLVLIYTALAKEKQARKQLDEALREATAGRRLAETEATKSRQVTHFLEEMLQGVGPAVALGRDTALLREILDRTAGRVGSEMSGQPEVEAELRGIIGRLYGEIGSYDRAERMLVAAVALNRKLCSTQCVATAMSLNDLGVVYWKQRKLKEAESAHREALSLREQAYGKMHTDVASSLNSLGAVYRRQGRLEEAERLTREGLDIRRALFGTDHLDIADSLRNLAIILGDRGQRKESEATAREMLAMRRKLLGNDHPLVASALSDLAWAAGFTGKTAEAEALETEALGVQRRLLGDEHPDVAKAVYSLGERMRQRGNFGEAHAVLSAAWSIQQKVLGESHPSTLDSMFSLATTLEQEGKLSEAEQLIHEGWILRQRRDPKPILPVLTLRSFEGWIRTLVAQGKFDAADAAFEEGPPSISLRRPECANLLLLRTDLRARRSRWAEAADDALLTATLDPTLNDAHAIGIAILAYLGDEPRYQEACRQFLRSHQETDNIFIQDQIAKSALLLPWTNAPLSKLAFLAENPLPHGVKDRAALPFFQLCKALSDYRQGRWMGSLEYANKALVSGNPRAQSHAYAILAMTQLQLGHREEAQVALKQAMALAPEQLPLKEASDRGRSWMAWLFTRTSIREATQLMEGAKIRTPNIAKP